MDTESSSQSSKPERTRRAHTRSRAGCLTCRKRHVRCDEGRPTCANCNLGSRTCEYAQSTICLRDRRAQDNAPPGAQKVWSISIRGESPSSSSGTTSSGQSPPTWKWRTLAARRCPDPFDTLAIPMQDRSRELLRYYYHAADAFGVAPKNVNDDCMALVVHDPAALRSTLLLAGLHYSWNIGQLSWFEPTLLAAKIDAIRSIDDWIKGSKQSAFADSVRQVATLAIVECCAGSLARAESHLDGLVTILEAGESSGLWESTLDKELVDRYFILVYNFIHGFKARVGEIASNDEIYKQDSSTSEEEKVGSRMHEHHIRELDGLETRLKAFRLFPHFFAPPRPSTIVKDIEVEPFLMCLNNITRMEQRRRAASITGDWDAVWNTLWMEGGPTRLFHAFVDSHVRSFSREPASSPSIQSAPGVPSLRSSWLGVSAASGMYLNGVLDLFNGGEATGGKVLVQVLRILTLDINATRPLTEKQARGRAGDLWLWKNMTGAFAMRKQLLDAEYCMDDGTMVLARMRLRLAEGMQYWGRLCGVSTWEGAKQALQRIVWLDEDKPDETGRQIWDGSANRGW